ncbi:CASC3/Barentsz eIF4AIII binding-domain-containing protein [Tirmania nivea]|nr:CASC3/Barentsz eIF4AIII binding-domain-containing protein [Tirmania nivea]
MATVHRRRRDLIASRRPMAEEGEEGGEDYNHELDDSLSDDSGLSEDEEEEEEDDDEDLSEDEGEEEGKAAAVEEVVKSMGQITIERPPVKEVMSGKTNGISQRAASPPASQTNESSRSFLKPSGPGTADTDFMLNGLKIYEQVAVEEGVDFDDEEALPEKISPAASASIKPVVLSRPSEKAQQEPARHETPFERRRREHEEYKKKRDADPAFVPNRGAFFMHDHRHQGGGSNGFKPFGRGGRGGRGGMFGRGMPFGRDASTEPVETTWKHDGFEELLAAERPKVDPQPPVRPQPPPRQEPIRKAAPINERPTIQIIVNLPGMKFPITFSEVPHRTHLRLPYHRPPLRRDKPVRISIPDQPIKYIYPHHNRSFVFIPRAMRPGGSGFIGGGISPAVRRGGLHRGPTRSIYAGSVATQSAAMSRRSSFQPDTTTQPASPAQAQAFAEPLPPSSPEDKESSITIEPHEPTQGLLENPVVKLSPSIEPLPKNLIDLSNQIDNTPSSPTHKPTAPVTVKPPSYPTPVPPIHDARGTPIIPMHQPKPQKTVSVADIETPASNMHYAINPYLPHHPHGYPDVNNEMATPTNGYPNNIYTHSRHPSYQSQPSTAGTPLSQLPDRAVHAQPFQPNCNSVPYAPTHYYPSPQAPAHVHPAHAHPHHATHTAMYHQPPPAYTASPQYVASPLPNGTPTAYHNVQQPQQTIAQESGGTVYFYDPNTYYAAYVAAQGGYGAPLTPAPEQGIGVPSGGTVYYYPPQGTVYYQ